jgi:hypothetical protein
LKESEGEVSSKKGKSEGKAPPKDAKKPIELSEDDDDDG